MVLYSAAFWPQPYLASWSFLLLKGVFGIAMMEKRVNLSDMGIMETTVFHGALRRTNGTLLILVFMWSSKALDGFLLTS